MLPLYDQDSSLEVIEHFLPHVAISMEVVETMTTTMMNLLRHTVLLPQILAKVVAQAKEITEQMRDRQAPIHQRHNLKLHKAGGQDSGRVQQLQLQQDQQPVISLDNDRLVNNSLSNPQHHEAGAWIRKHLRRGGSKEAQVGLLLGEPQVQAVRVVQVQATHRRGMRVQGSGQRVEGEVV